MAERQTREVQEPTRAKQSAKKMGELNPNFGKPRNSDTKQKISQALQRYWQKIPQKTDSSGEMKGF